MSGIPVESFESATPLVIWRKSLISGSGGRGRFAGGMGQRVEIGVRIDEPWSANVLVDRVVHPPQGLFGGAPGRGGRVFTSKRRSSVHSKKRLLLAPDERLVLETPGGGGYGARSADMPSPRAGRSAQAKK